MIREINECSTDIQALGQDIHSFEKEQLEHYPCNIVGLLADTCSWSIEQATSKALTLHRNRQRTLLQAERQVPDLMAHLGYPDHTPKALAYVAAIKGMAFSLHYWFGSNTNQRYDLDHPASRGRTSPASRHHFLEGLKRKRLDHAGSCCCYAEIGGGG